HPWGAFSGEHRAWSRGRLSAHVDERVRSQRRGLAAAPAWLRRPAPEARGPGAISGRDHHGSRPRTRRFRREGAVKDYCPNRTYATPAAAAAPVASGAMAMASAIWSALT